LLNDSTDSSLTEEQEDLFMYASASLYIGMSIPVDIPKKSADESTGGTNTVILTKILEDPGLLKFLLGYITSAPLHSYDV
jgi:hypothetical protein